jgi:AcrR family transcriptional regulator
MAEGEKKIGLRERQRRTVQAELREAALRLFEARGFDDVSVAEIAAEAGISERTFFRHFATKEDVVLTVLEGFGTDIVTRLESAPLDRSWFEILRDTYLGVVSVDVTMDGDQVEYLRQAAGRVYELAKGSPRLQAGIDARSRGWANDIAEIIARRMGVDVDRDPRPHVWATTVIAAAGRNTARRVAIGLPTGNLAEAFDALEEFMSKLPGSG